MRSIQNILHFRSDLSPFLVHLTRPHGDQTAKDCLQQIISTKALVPGVLLHESAGAMSDARFAVSSGKLTDEQRYEFFGFVSFTETPLSEIHCLFDVDRREVNLEPYGLVFLKNRLKTRSVSPVFYVNNIRGDKDALVRALATLVNTNPNEAAQILPLVAIFGQKLTPKGAARQTGNVDFTWEREWRCPYADSMPLAFTKDDVFVGLCPDNEIREFQKLFWPVRFIDPTLNVKRYALKLIGARKRLKLKHSVV